MVTLVLVLWPKPQQEAKQVVEVNVRPHGRNATHAAASETVLIASSLDSIHRGQADEDAKNLFNIKSWYVPPPPPKPKPPAPPPLPFTYLGKEIDGAQITVFVAQGDRNYALKTGDVIDGIYRVEAIAPPVMTLTYIPLRMQQTLEIGGAN